MEELEIGKYLEFVFRRLNEEQRRVDRYLSHTSRDGLCSCVDRCFVGEFVELILAKGQ